MDTALILDSLPALAGGLVKTLHLVAVALLLGLLLAVPVAVARLSAVRPLALLAGGYVFVFRATPLLVQIFLIYYGFGQVVGQMAGIRESWIWPLLREPFWYAVLALMLNSAAYTAEIIRGGIQSIPAGQVEAAKALGMSRLLAFRLVVLPQAFRQALPAYGNEMIQMVQASALASTITLMELTGVARAIMSRTFQPVEVFVIAGAFYLAVNFTLTLLVRAAERRMAAGH